MRKQYTCAQCGTSFHRPASAFKNSKRTYCSVACTGYGKLLFGCKHGVYELVCLRAGMRYIGSSVDLASRWSAHRRELKHGCHHIKSMQSAWDQHGAAAFEFRLIEAVSDPSLLRIREQAHIERCRATGIPLFNLAPNAGSTKGLIHSDARRIEMRTNPKRHYTGKFCEADIQSIRERFARGAPFEALATKYHVHPHTIYCIVTGRMYGDTPIPDSIQGAIRRRIRKPGQHGPRRLTMQLGLF